MTNEQLCTLAQQGDTQAQEQLVQNNLGYIRKTANELYISVGLGDSELGIDHDDLIQEGSIGLLRAISLYDHEVPDLCGSCHPQRHDGFDFGCFCDL